MNKNYKCEFCNNYFNDPDHAQCLGCGKLRCVNCKIKAQPHTVIKQYCSECVASTKRRIETLGTEMTKRYYYTDPIKAAYMTKEFGVKFLNEDGWECFYEDGNWWADEKIGGITKTHSVTDGKFYIAKESESIFKQKIGDMTDQNFDKIVVRDNELFFTPKTED